TRSLEAHRRTSGLSHLTSLAPDEAVPALLKALDDPEAFVRSTAAEHLGRLGAPQAVPLLRTLLTDPDVHVRRAAATALAWRGDRNGLPLIVRTPSHPGTRFELNRLRRSEVCNAWSAKILSGPQVTGSTREMIEEVAKRAGISVEYPPDLIWSSYVDELSVEGRDLLSVLSGLL